MDAPRARLRRSSAAGAPIRAPTHAHVQAPRHRRSPRTSQQQTTHNRARARATVNPRAHTRARTHAYTRRHTRTRARVSSWQWSWNHGRLRVLPFRAERRVGRSRLRSPLLPGGLLLLGRRRRAIKPGAGPQPDAKSRPASAQPPAAADAPPSGAGERVPVRGGQHPRGPDRVRGGDGAGARTPRRSLVVCTMHHASARPRPVRCGWHPRISRIGSLARAAGMRPRRRLRR
jgi:hypothetical protein